VAGCNRVWDSGIEWVWNHKQGGADYVCTRRC